MSRIWVLLLLTAAPVAAGGDAIVLTSAPDASSFHVSVRAGTHQPRVGARWRYAVHVTGARGKPLRARLTMEVLDPLGTAHPVELGTTTRKIKNWPVRGTFRDFAIWPASSRGVRLTLRATVRANHRRQRASYWVQPR